MGIKYPVAAGTLVLCDYGTGFRPPEMVKRRPAIVVSNRLPHRDGLCTVIPLSTTPPPQNVKYVVKIELSETLPPPFDAPVMWAKCDMLATVCFERLELFRTGRDHEGKRQYLNLRLPPAQMLDVKDALRYALGLG